MPGIKTWRLLWHLTSKHSQNAWLLQDLLSPPCRLFIPYYNPHNVPFPLGSCTWSQIGPSPPPTPKTSLHMQLPEIACLQTQVYKSLLKVEQPNSESHTRRQERKGPPKGARIFASCLSAQIVGYSPKKTTDSTCSLCDTYSTGWGKKQPRSQRSHNLIFPILKEER